MQSYGSNGGRRFYTIWEGKSEQWLELEIILWELQCLDGWFRFVKCYAKINVVLWKLVLSSLDLWKFWLWQCGFCEIYC
jgi:hypothetical protein